MVLIINSTGDDAIDIDRIAKCMINIESNRIVYNEYGEKVDKKEKFNVYQDEFVEYDFILQYAKIILYLRPDQNFSYCEIQNKIMNLTIPIQNFIHKNSDNYNLIEIKPSNTITKNNCGYSSKVFRFITSNFDSFKKSLKTDRISFSWFIEKFNKTNSFYIPELYPKIPPEEYLNKSIFTVIYDGVGMFQNNKIIKQINYPSLKQYYMYNKCKIIEEPIYISLKEGLIYEIYNYFKGSLPKLYLPHKVERNMKYNLKYKDFPDYNIKRVDLERTWEDQILDDFDYKKQEEIEKNLNKEDKNKFRNDICFISRIPLYDRYYIVRISNKTCEFNIAVSPCGFEIFMCLSQIIYKDKGYKILSVIERNYSKKRKFLDVLDTLAINPIKKNIMKCIELYGCYMTEKMELYTVDKKTSQIYVGLEQIGDADIIKYSNTNTILFRIIPVMFLDRENDIILNNKIIDEY